MHIGVIGGGRMGKDVFDIFSRNGFQVTMYVRRADAAAALEDELLGPLRRRASKGGSRAAAAQEQLDRLKVTSSLQDLASCDLINENIAEDVALKQALFRQLDGICSSTCIFSTDSSFITPDLLTPAISHPGRMIGLHFFYPTRLTSFVEVIPGPQTDADVTGQVVELVRRLKVRPIVCQNVPGFLVNRLIPAFYIEGVIMLEEGHHTATEIDGAVKGSLTHLGPLESCDMIGLDIVEKGNVEFPHIWREGWLNPPLLHALIEAGRLGAKGGAGFYRYDDGKPIDETASLPVTARRHTVEPYGREEIIDRLYYTMVVEAFRQLDLGVGSEQDIDDTLREVLGFRVGPIQGARQQGLEQVRERLTALTRRFGDRFAPRGSLA